MMFAAGVHWGYFAAGFAAVAVAFPAIWALGDKFILNQDQKNRFLAILYPDLYAKNEAFQQNRGIGAIGSGQFFGQGLFNGNYTQSGAVPENQNDFVFSVAGEELGFIGAIAVLVLLAAIILRIVINGKRANDNASYLMCMGMAPCSPRKSLSISVWCFSGCRLSASRCRFSARAVLLTSASISGLG